MLRQTLKEAARPGAQELVIELNGERVVVLFAGLKNGNRLQARIGVDAPPSARIYRRPVAEGVEERARRAG